MCRNIITAGLLVLLAFQVAAAEPDSAQLGGYMLTFDMGLPVDSYTKETALLESGAITLTITGYMGEATIAMKYDPSGAPWPVDGLKAAAKAALKQIGAENIYTTTTVVDGREAGMAAGDVRTTHISNMMYQHDNNTLVLISSTFPLEHGTGDLRGSLHIEEA